MIKQSKLLIASFSLLFTLLIFHFDVRLWFLAMIIIGPLVGWIVLKLEINSFMNMMFASITWKIKSLNGFPSLQVTITDLAHWVTWFEVPGISGGIDIPRKFLTVTSNRYALPCIFT